MNSIVSKEQGAVRRQLAREAFARVINKEFALYLPGGYRVGPNNIKVKMERGLSHGYGYKCLWESRETVIGGAFRKESDDEAECVWIVKIKDGHAVNEPFTPFSLGLYDKNSISAPAF